MYISSFGPKYNSDFCLFVLAMIYASSITNLLPKELSL